YLMIFWTYDKKRALRSEFYKRKIRRAWRNAINQHDRSAELYACDIEPLGSFKKAMQYVSKYLAKEDDNIGRKIKGRRWAVSKSLPCRTITEVNLTQAQFEDVKQIV